MLPMFHKTKIIAIIILFLFIHKTTSGQWQQMNGPYSGAIKSIAAKGSTIIASTTYGGSPNYAFISSDGGYSWKTLNSQNNIPAGCNAFVIDGANIFAQNYLSTDTGNSFTLVNNGMPAATVYTLLLSGTDLFAGFYGSGIYKSINNGNSWIAMNTGLTNLVVHSLATNGNVIYAGTNQGIFLSTNNGNNWSIINNGFVDSVFNNIAVIDTAIFACVGDGDLYVSRNNGITWNFTGIVYSNDIAISNGNVFASSYNGVYLSTDTGSTWIPANTGLSTSPDSAVLTLTIDSSRIYAGTSKGLYLSVNNGANWHLIGCPDLVVRAFGQMGTNFFSSAYNNIYPYPGGFYVSIDSGLNWENRTVGLPSNDVRQIVTLNTTILIGVYSYGFYLSNDTGKTWVAANNGIPANYNYRSVAVVGSNLLASCHDGSNGGLYLSIDNGNSWSAMSSNILGGLTVGGNTVFAGTGGVIVMSLDSGITWLSRNNTGIPNIINRIFFEGNKLFISPAANGLYVSTDSANTWSQLNNGLPIVNSYIMSGAYDGANYYMGVQHTSQDDSVGVFISSDNCNSWTKYNDGLTNATIITMMRSGNYLFAGTGASVFRRFIGGIPTTAAAIEGNKNHFDFKIYPNPTTNQFNITSFNNIDEIKIADVLGQVVYHITPKEKNVVLQLEHEGWYFVSVISNNQTATKKLIVF